MVASVGERSMVSQALVAYNGSVDGSHVACLEAFLYAAGKRQLR